MKKAQTNTMGFIAGLAAVSLLAGAAGYGLYHYTGGGHPSPALAQPAEDTALPAVDAELIGRPRPEFVLPDLEGKPRNINQWAGKVVLVNFWATWCPPCRREIPAFIEVREAYADQGFEIVGVAIDEPQQVQDFVDGMGVEYPVLVGALEASEIARQYGNRYGALPYSVLIDRDGRIRFIQPGELTREALEAELKRLL